MKTILILLLLIQVNYSKSIGDFLNTDCVKDDLEVINFWNENLICNSNYTCPSAIFCSKINNNTNLWRCGGNNINTYKQNLRIELKKCKLGIIKNSEKIYVNDNKIKYNYIILFIIGIFLVNTILRDNEFLKFLKFFVKQPSIYDWFLLILYLLIITEDKFYNIMVYSYYI